MSRPGVSAAIAAALLYAATLALLYPDREVFAFDPDEGVAAMRAVLVGQGHALYTEIWEDQPPLFIQLLSAWFTLFGASIDGGRLLVLAFGALAVFALYDVLRRESGHLAALVGCGLLACSAYFARLSVSMMPAVPAQALALLALWALYRWLHGGSRAWIAAAGACMSAALAVKLVVGFMVPVFALWLLVVGRRDGGPRWRPPLIWLTSCAAVTLLWLLVWVGPAQWALLGTSHLTARHAPLLERLGPLGLLLTGWAEWPLTTLGVVSCAALLHWRRWTLSVFPFWAVTALLCLMLQHPYWYHYQLLITVPYCAAAGAVVAALFARGAAGVPAHWLLPLRGAAVALIVCQTTWTLAGTPAPPPVAAFDGDKRRMLAAIEAAGGERRMVTNDAMFAFRAGYDVPPAIANLCLKRIATDGQLAERVGAAFAQHPPALVLLAAGVPAPLAEYAHAGMLGRYAQRFAENGSELYQLRSDQPPADARADR